MVCFAWAAKKRDTLSRKLVFTGDREAVRRQSVITALQGLLEFIR
jgi:nicotinamide-nucleotide amidase